MKHDGPRAIIFDFNGVIADDELIHFLAFQQVLSEFGLSLTKKEYYGTYLGMDERTCAATLIGVARGKKDNALVDQITARKSSLFRTLTATQKPALFAGVIELVKEMSPHCRLAIASGGRRDQIDYALHDTPIEKDFSVVVSAEDAPLGKPDPSIYLIALEKLNRTAPTPGPRLSPPECVVIEDTIAGIRSARRAGMPVVGVATTYAPDKLADASLVVAHLNDLNWTRLQDLFQ
jgi:beta-phosphoglucomutase